MYPFHIYEIISTIWPILFHENAICILPMPSNSQIAANLYLWMHICPPLACMCHFYLKWRWNKDSVNWFKGLLLADIFQNKNRFNLHPSVNAVYSCRCPAIYSTVADGWQYSDWIICVGDVKEWWHLLFTFSIIELLTSDSGSISIKVPDGALAKSEITFEFFELSRTANVFQ